MTLIRFYYIMIGVTLFSSGIAQKPITSKLDPKEVTDIQKFETFSYITLIEGKNTGKLDDTISEKSREIFEETMATFHRIPVTGKIHVEDSMIRMRMERETGYLLLTADEQRSISGLELTPVLDSLLEAAGKRFGLITVTAGFTRVKGNYGGQIAKGVAVGLLTLGMYSESPIKANSTVYVMIVDAMDNKVRFFRKSSLNKEPLDKDVLTKQIQKLFDGYFWEK